MPIDITGTEGFTNGPYQKPSSGDQGNTVYDTIEEFMERMANHNHDGGDSKEISLNIAKDIEVFEIGVDLVWENLSNGEYRANLPVPVATTYDASIRKFFLAPTTTTDFKEFYPTVEKISNSNYYVYTNNNQVDLKVVTL
jgi:hypothetical protein